MSETFNKAGLLALYSYNAYANRLVLDIVDKLTSDEFTRNSSPSHNSARQLLNHMLECEAFFLAQCQEPPGNPLEMELSTAADICSNWEQLAKAQADFISSLDEAGLSRTITVQLRGQGFIFPVWQLLTQAVVHSIHHRGELSIILTELGHPLPTLDILLHFIEQSGQTWPSA